VRKAGAIDLPTLQRYLNFWFSSSLDLFGSESSSNAASYFASGLKGRPDESQYEDHIARDVTATLEVPDGKGGVTTETLPLRNAMNETVRGAYVRDCEIGVKRWNRLIQKAGIGRELSLPSTRFRRSIGAWAGVSVTPEGRIVSREAWEHGAREWLPSESDRGFVQSLMQQVVEPGKMAAWIAPPDRGINNLAVDHEYVHLQ
jgi:benzoyl-CoA 2,3-dioxygenase component B